MSGEFGVVQFFYCGIYNVLVAIGRIVVIVSRPRKLNSIVMLVMVTVRVQ